MGVYESLAGAQTIYSGSSLSYEIPGRPNGTYYFRVKAIGSSYSDSDWRTGSNGCTVTLTVPIAHDSSHQTPVNETFEGTLSATPPEPDTELVYNLVSLPATGTATILDSATGAFRYVPATGFIGTETFTFKVNDGSSDSNVATVTMTVGGAIVEGINPPIDDTGILGLIRSDGGDDGSNLLSGKPKLLDYRFEVVVQDTSGSVPAAVVLILNGQEYVMSLVSGTFAEGATFAINLQLGPAASWSFHFEARDAQGNVLHRYPFAGDTTLDGPVVQILNGYSMGGIPAQGQSAGVVYDGLTVRKWVSAGLSNAGNSGDFVTLATGDVLEPGRGYFIRRIAGSPSRLPAVPAGEMITADTVELALQAGWNMISNPYAKHVDLADLMVKRGTDTAVSWMDAATSGWVINAIYTYSGSDWGRTYSFASAGGSPEAVLAPWTGLWIYVSRADATYTLIFNKP